MEVIVYNTKGSELERIELDESVFGVPMNEAVVHQAMVQQLANARLGTAKAKSRGEVAGSTRKLYRQKGTGRARAGSAKSPLRRHGGVIFGPKPRDYHQSMPKKMRRLAIRCVLSSKVTEGEFKVIDKIEFDGPKTDLMLDIIRALKIERSALIAISESDSNVVKSARNLPGVDAIQARQLNVVDLLNHRDLVITTDALRQIEELWGQKETADVLG